jgi:hypothetical protein
VRSSPSVSHVLTSHNLPEVTPEQLLTFCPLHSVPLLISTVKVALQIILELMFISTVHISSVKPTIIKQAAISLVCRCVWSLSASFCCVFIALSGRLTGFLPRNSLVASAAGLFYYSKISRRMSRALDDPLEARPSLHSLLILGKPGSFTFAESAVRNAIYLYLVHNVVSMGQTYATAWGVFSTIRWGLISTISPLPPFLLQLRLLSAVVPVQSLEATSNAFVGHRWGRYLRRRQLASETTHNWIGSWQDPLTIARPALTSVLIALTVEIPLCLGLSFGGARPFARYLSASDEVAEVAQKMWRTIDWCYIMYAVSTQLATVLLATKPSWYVCSSSAPFFSVFQLTIRKSRRYLVQSLIANIFYCLPWVIALGAVSINVDNAWTYHALVFVRLPLFFLAFPPMLTRLCPDREEASSSPSSSSSSSTPCGHGGSRQGGSSSFRR